MIRCSHCATDNLDGSEYCDECGTKLAASGNPPVGKLRQTYTPPPGQFVTRVAPPPPSFTNESVTPQPATPYTPPPPPPPITPAPVLNPGPGPGTQVQPVSPAATPLPPPPPIQAMPPVKPVVARHEPAPAPATDRAHAPLRSSSNGQYAGAETPEAGKRQAMSNENPSANEIHVRAKLIIQRGGKIGKEFPLVGMDCMIGRWDADGGIFPDVDLDQDDPEAKVSRRHARIQLMNNQYLIEDLGSTNGTFINRGPRLLPGSKQPLNHGDEIIVGKTFLKFVLN